MLQSLNHLTLAVSNLQTSVNFWRDLLGLSLHAQWDTGAYLTCGDLWLCLSFDETRNYVPPEKSDYTHYAFSVAPEDFDAFSHKLEQAGVTVWKINKSEGASFYFLDPDGHKLELHVGDIAARLAACREKPYAGMRFYSSD
ncbi:FosA family fosfomycin resistance glutathione transferase [Lelliottia sp. V106_10]|uniref:FosA family fosfomycin resistance glutathione transferase n=1 Tax=Lelliottia wanjuensis TaxID=3050585 RepID=UPI00254AF5EE|nr:MULTISPECIES: FosA family fosfomycin resistance glutathione transferase [unclassified Lelliottia]MDK9358950.1 FosA family fosfomycin resistance glutathione transferase [Lelliottia sp. V106_16]MDK9373638.1 FosA family fosfomycin resistance glutathione transferase [Lelliottia sp. V106_10]MDK9600322.1 FosA family fosfomycin resistance glutathione transferase [Lelliottia sp. V106_5]